MHGDNDQKPLVNPPQSKNRSSRFRLLTQAIKAYQTGQLGDAAAYKSALLGTQAYPDIAEQLAQLPSCFPKIDLTELRDLPHNSFGYIYAQHMDDCHLTPLEISPAVTEQLRPQPLGLRYTLTHDIFHVLLGYDTSLVGELGVWSFVGAQHYSPSYATAATLAHYVYPLIAPHKYRQFRASERRSKTLAQQAICLIAQPFEHYWPQPLTTVRQQFKLSHLR